MNWLIQIQIVARFASNTSAQTAGAGTIIQRRQQERIEGLTTSASILFTAAVGIAVALDQIYLATGVTLLVVVINYFLKFLEKLLKTKSDDS